MKLLAKILITCFQFSLALAASHEPVRSPILAKEEVQFIARKEDEILFIGKVQEFVGVFERTFEKNPDLQNPELYALPRLGLTKMDISACTQVVAKLFNSGAQKNLKSQSQTLRLGPLGKVCEVHLIDTASYAKFKEKHLITGFIGGKLYGLVFKFQKNSTSQSEEDARGFWDGLR